MEPIWTKVGSHGEESELLTIRIDLEGTHNSKDGSTVPWPIYLYIDADDSVYTNLSYDNLPDPKKKRQVRIWRNKFGVYGCKTPGHCDIELYISDTPEINDENQLEIVFPIRILPETPLRIWSANLPAHIGSALLPPSQVNQQPRRYPYILLNGE
jgi:hypothetical protein